MNTINTIFLPKTHCLLNLIISDSRNKDYFRVLPSPQWYLSLKVWTFPGSSGVPGL